MSEQKSNVEGSIKKDFASEFMRERKEWTDKIKILSVRLKNIREVVDVQVDLFSYRQILLEYSSKLGHVIVKLNAKYRKDKSDRLKYYSESHQVRYGSNEKNPLIEGDLSDIKERIDTIECQVSFINETIKTIDHFLYGIKSRIQLEEYMRSGSQKG